MNGASDNTIGGPAVGARNLVSGNFWGVVAVGEATGNLVHDNFDRDGCHRHPLGGQRRQRNPASKTRMATSPAGPFPRRPTLPRETATTVWSPSRANSERIPGELRRDRSHRYHRAWPIANSGVPDQTKLPGTSSAGRFPEASNLISGNGANGVRIYWGSTSNEVLGNYIGTDVTGTLALGNTGDGIEIVDSLFNTIGGTSPGARNVISSNNRGVIIQRLRWGPEACKRGSNQVLGNYIGTDVTGTVDLGKRVPWRGGQGPATTRSGARRSGGAQRHLGQRRERCLAEGDPASYDNQVLGNYIGVDVQLAAVPLGNTGYRRRPVGGRRLQQHDRGHHSGRAEHHLRPTPRGVLTSTSSSTLGTTGNQVLGNFIGTDVSGTIDLGNDLAGVLIEDGSDNTIGGTTAGVPPTSFRATEPTAWPSSWVCRVRHRQTWCWAT